MSSSSSSNTAEFGHEESCSGDCFFHSDPDHFDLCHIYNCGSPQVTRCLCEDLLEFYSELLHYINGDNWSTDTINSPTRPLDSDCDDACL